MTDLQFNTAPQSRAFLAPSISSFPPADIFYDPDYSDSDSDVEELFDADDFVSVAHDLLLVKLRCFRPKSEVSNLSAAFQHEFGVVIESQQLEARLQKLQAPEVRALLVLYLKAVSNSTESQYSNNSGLEILPEYQSLLETHTLNEKLLLTDTAPRYDSTNAFNHFEQPIFDRLTLFAKDPDIVERLALQRQQQVEAGRIKQQLSQQLQTIFETLRLKQAAKLEQLQAEEFENIKSQLDRSLEADLQHIRQMHTALLNHEQAKINAKYQEQKAVLTEKVACMHREVMALQKKYISEEDKLPQFVLRRELTSKMIADTTILAILKQSTTKDLREVESYGANFLHQDLVSRELHTRKDLAVPQLRFYLNGDLTLPLRRTNNSGAGLSTSVSEISTNFGIAVANPAYRLVPVVSMYSSSKKPQMRVSFNFRGDFKFSIPGFDPFGAPL
ncbi:hypothetical protein BBP00_00007270 [Phytophthora kernoviae]|uniref:Uncharacterized protein n=1 Tax=Phytophthora kernoviae TaxID=325452 RepID=A0A3F2RIU7_9STRA|nr:hypothetical protein BBP00_00007270 [Phytophthora kernoviae]